MHRVACFCLPLDLPFYEELKRQLLALELDQDREILPWCNHDIPVGNKTDVGFDNEVKRADVLIFFLNPDLRRDKELWACLLQAHALHTEKKTPMLLLHSRSVMYERWPGVGTLPILPRGGRFLGALEGPELEAAMTEVARTVRDFLNQRETEAAQPIDVASPRRVAKSRWLAWMPLALVVIPVMAGLAYFSQPQIHSGQDPQGRHQYQVTRLWSCSDCSARLNGGERSPTAPCPQTFLIPAQALVPASLIFYCGARTYEVDFSNDPIRLRRSAE